MRSQRFAYVDLIRGISALVILVTHYHLLFARDVDVGRTDAALPFDIWLWPIYDHGGIAVKMFWILSGFVFAVAYGEQGKSLDQRAFWLHRFARLYPLHFATLCLVALLQAVSVQINGGWIIEGNNDWPHFVLQLFLASNWFTMEGSFNSPIWSVSAEVLVYLMFATFLAKGGMSLRWAILLSLVGLAIRIATANPVSLCMALFFAGVAVAIVVPILQRLFGSGLVPLAAAALAGAVAVGVAINAAGHGEWVPEAMIYLGTPAVLILFVSLDLNCRPLSPRLNWIGGITYSVYLLHFPALIALRLAFGDGLAPSPLTLFAYMAMVIAASLATHRWFEMPAQRFIRQRLARPAAMPAPLPPISPQPACLAERS